MASQTVPPSVSPGQLHPIFAQIFHQFTAAQLTLSRRSEAPIYCEYELPRFGGEKCGKVAVVTNLETEQEMCLGHHQAVSRG
jgi:hypothetical protein